MRHEWWLGVCQLVWGELLTEVGGGQGGVAVLLHGQRKRSAGWVLLL